MPTELFTSKLSVLLPEWRIEVFDSLPSTNSYLKTLSAGRNLTVSLCQSGGRGRLGRTFHSGPGGLYMSFEAEVGGDTPDIVTMAAGLAVAEAVESALGVRTSIKWVNDVLGPDGRKICGILCEGMHEGPSRRIIIGAGVNITNVLPQPLSKAAAAIGEYVPGVDFPSIAPILAANIVNGTLKKLSSCDFIDRYRTRCATLGKIIRTEANGIIAEGRAVDIDNTGGLVVEYIDGNMGILRFGEAEILK